ncbi:FlxA-like family protein [Achromobacter deleyi]|uniref:FlxA-like family protein n=1 Tax=Achromobacter deleyi TaxID=1353891 RepID=A0A7T4B8Q1_9BURK|nr:FlxA-like family protein [Achromobacter deleyi]QQB37735.1 FlxA-like family protein [Achromobacter deleyi]
MAIDSISGTSRIGSMADLWAQKIQANKEAKDAKAGDPGVSVTPDGKIRVNNAGAMKVGQTQETESSDNDDSYTRQIKELQRQLKRIMEQIERVRASNASAEQKATQIQALNAQAVQVMGQIQKVMELQAKAAQTAARAASRA